MESIEHQVVLSFGSNLGDSEQIIKNAYEKLKMAGVTFLKESAFYASPPWGFKAENDFVNSIALVCTSRGLADLLLLTQEIEKGLGRSSKTGLSYSSRKIDIDIIDFDGQIFSDDSICVPHASCHLRAFVLVPLKEIMADWTHPKLQLNIDQIIQEFKVDSNTLKI
jgi:2-amino-4-hydroxy-6-hydroxymethyldihydropteridine diphosphokinase